MGKMEAEEAELERWQGEKGSGQHCWLRIGKKGAVTKEHRQLLEAEMGK